MKLSLLLISIVLLVTNKTLAQVKDSVKLTLDFFDSRTGDRYGFDKKFDHIPTHNDSVNFQQESSTAFHKMIDSVRKQKAIRQKPKRKKINKTKP